MQIHPSDRPWRGERMNTALGYCGTGAGSGIGRQGEGRARITQSGEDSSAHQVADATVITTG